MVAGWSQFPHLYLVDKLWRCDGRAVGTLLRTKCRETFGRAWSYRYSLAFKVVMVSVEPRLGLWHDVEPVGWLYPIV